MAEKVELVHHIVQELILKEELIQHLEKMDMLEKMLVT
jgi:hypothetical protein